MPTVITVEMTQSGARSPAFWPSATAKAKRRTPHASHFSVIDFAMDFSDSPASPRAFLGRLVNGQPSRRTC